MKQAGGSATAGARPGGAPGEVRGSTGPLDLDRIRKDFPILARKVHGKRLVYLDSAATTQKPEVVIEAIQDVLAQ